ncbi:NAD(P)-binding protein [Lentinula boryana]|uniref:NAD(P)-binding protein n=1 Tax=Lentinula boryana TaxID=40481 RepID=A0ABQ8Q6T2_9AGAR|nr:NAD(P)-binding protein [Lentinula boryana]
MSFQHPRLLNRGVALVTSAAKGAGRAIALRLASEGFKVAVHDLPHNGELLLNVHRNIQRLGQHSVVLAADITEEDQVKSLVEDTYKCLGGLDVMVANTAVRESAPLISTATAEAWNRLFDVNARGVFFCYKYAAQQMISEGKGGRIIGGCSAWGKKGSPFMSAYSASHFAVRGLTESAALELHEHGITVNSYAPDRCYRLIGSIASASTIRNGSLAHCETPQAIAHLVSYLVSEEAHYITGKILYGIILTTTANTYE